MACRDSVKLAIRPTPLPASAVDVDCIEYASAKNFARMIMECDVGVLHFFDSRLVFLVERSTDDTTICFGNLQHKTQHRAADRTDHDPFSELQIHDITIVRRDNRRLF